MSTIAISPLDDLTTERATPSRTWILRLVATVLAVLALVAGVTASSQPASALSSAVISGRPGFVYTGQATAGCAQAGQVFRTTATLPYVGLPAMTTLRSPATSGVQTVIVNYGINQWTGSSWQQIRTASASSVIPSGVGSVAVRPSGVIQVNGGYYRVTARVNWYSGGTLIGQTDLHYDAASDYAPGYGSRPTGTCQIFSGYIELRP